MTIRSSTTQFVKIRYDDPRFKMTDGFATYDVAGIEITNNCPGEHMRHIVEAMHKGWVVPFAMIKQEMDYCI